MKNSAAVLGMIVSLVLVGAGCKGSVQPAAPSANPPTHSQPEAKPESVPADTTNPTEDAVSTSTEQWNYAPAEVKAVFEQDGITHLSIDILTHNPDFLPGVTDFFINKNLKLRDVTLNSDSKAYRCGAGTDGEDTTPDVPTSLQQLINDIQKTLATNDGRGLMYYFDIDGALLKIIYEQCLP